MNRFTLRYLQQKYTEKSLKKNKNWLEKMSQWFSIVGTLISVILAIYVSIQQTEIKKLNGIIEELQCQHNLTREETKEIINHTFLLQKQDSILGKNEMILSNQLAILLQEKAIEKSKNFQEITSIYARVSFISILSSYYTGNIFVLKLSKHEQIDFFENIKKALDDGLKNSYIVSNKNIYNYWVVFKEQTQTTCFTFSDDPAREYYLNRKEISKNDYLIQTYNRFMEYFETFIKKGLEPLLQTTDFRNDWLERIKKTNFGRPDK